MLVGKDLGLFILSQLLQVGVGFVQQQIDQESECFLENDGEHNTDHNLILHRKKIIGQLLQVFQHFTVKFSTIFHNIEENNRLRSQKKAERIRIMILTGSEAIVIRNKERGGP